MPETRIPPGQWAAFLEGFSRRHFGWLVRFETHDLQTGENVHSRYVPLQLIELDTEDTKNPRINVTVTSELKLIKHVLFRPSRLSLTLLQDGAEELLKVESVNTSTTIRFRAAASPDVVDEVA